MEKLYDYFFVKDNLPFTFQVVIRIVVLFIISMVTISIIHHINDIIQLIGYISSRKFIYRLLIFLFTISMLPLYLGICSNIEIKFFLSPFPLCFIPLFIFTLSLDNNFLIACFIIFFSIFEMITINEVTREIFFIDLDDITNKDRINKILKVCIGFSNPEQVVRVKRLVEILASLINEFDSKQAIVCEHHMMKREYYILQRYRLVKIVENENKYNIYIENDIYEYYKEKKQKKENMNFEYRIARKIAKNNDIPVEEVHSIIDEFLLELDQVLDTGAEVKLQFLGKLERNIDNYIINTELEQYTKMEEHNK